MWLLLHNPNLRIGIGSENLDKAKEIISEVIGHYTTNKKFIETFGNWVNKTPAASAFNVLPRTKIARNKTYTAFSCGATPTGSHFDVIILDDIAGRDNSGTAIMRELQINTYIDCTDLLVKDEVKHFQSGDSDDPVLCLVGTRWHFADVYNYVISKNIDTLDFVVDRASLINERVEKRDPVGWRRNITEMLDDPDTKVLFPQKFTLEELKEKYRDKGTYEFSCQQMNFPVSDEGVTFKPEDVQIITPEEFKPADFTTNVQMVDPAGLDVSYQRSDDWAVVTMSISAKKFYVRDVDARNKVSVNTFLDMIISAYQKWNPYYIIIEENFCKSNSYILKTEYPQVQKIIKGVKARTTQSKAQKIRGLQPFFEQKQFFIVSDDGNPKAKDYPFMGKIYKLTEGKIKLIEQIIDYGHTEHDDCIDAVSLLLEVIKPKHTQPKTFNKMTVSTAYKPVNERTGY